MKKPVKLKMLVAIAGLAEPRYDLPEFSYVPEQVVEVHPDLATAWVVAGHAEAVAEDKQRKAS